ncbi:hypothetical protein G6F40_017555 [Rhizopus arrhizus]|nr:hypothetical protein G6F40_017555 [Rhizopus arrhizus]
MVPPIIAAMPSKAQQPASACGSQGVASAPSAPPKISNGASTPPDVPDPRAIDQIATFTTSSSNTAWNARSPASRWRMLS